MSFLRSLARRLFAVLSSIGLACVLIILLGILTWLGTLEQVDYGLYEVQKKYFESFFLVHDAGGVPIPLPGANLVLCVLAVNLILGGMVRLRKSWSKAGILVTHLGIAMILLSGFVKMYFSEDGHVTLYENERADWFQSYFRWEIAIREEAAGGVVREYVVPQEDFLDARGERVVRLANDELPFELEVQHVLQNCWPSPKGPMFDVDMPVVDGVYLERRPMAAEAEQNVAGLYVASVDAESGARTPGILWGLESAPWTVEAGGGRWAVTLRKERYPMPFTLVLDEFTKEDHPRMNMPKSFSSDVTVEEDGSSRPVEISMNEPLRDRGLVLYQASWGPSTAGPGDPLFSTFSVVRNPADQMPLWGCVVTAIGLLLHFLRKLARHVRAEGRTA